jgi:purine-binding chemotaxis protein CheW
MEDTEEIVVAEEEGYNSQADKYLLFNLGREVYGVSIVNVTEIIEMQNVTEVPDMPAFVKGVINLRGRVIPVVDLRLRFGMSEREYDDRTCIVIASIRDTVMGFIVDTVAEVLDIPETDIEPPPSFRDESGKGRYISGIGKVGSSVKILIDVNRILNDKDFTTIEENT